MWKLGEGIWGRCTDGPCGSEAHRSRDLALLHHRADM